MNSEDSSLSRNLPCVKCKETLSTIKSFDGVVVDRCRQCSGTWYDGGELEQVLGPAFDYQALMRTVSMRFSDYICPCCKMAMRALVFKFQHGELVIDHCSVCRGFWLDSGELESVKNLVETIRDGVAPVRIGFSSARPISERVGYVNLDEKPLLKDSALDHYRSVDYETGSEIDQIGVSAYLFSALTALPIEVFNPVKAPAFAMYLLIMLNIAVYIHTGSLVPDKIMPFMREFGAVPLDVLSGKLHTLVTSMFLHINFWHLFANMYVLFVFGDNVYDLFNDHGKTRGPLTFVVFYLILGVLSCLIHIILAAGHPVKSTVPAVGASGAVSGIMAAYCRAFPKSRIYQIIFWYPFKLPIWLYLGIWVLLNIALGLIAGSGARVSWQAHLGGFAFGYLLLPHFMPFHLERLQVNSQKGRVQQ
ncbi:MAG TPA: hypothetical protein DCG57_09435 [Candidatus Riflebacteria bacterium]|jgi:membrane associated rhomboid family serine protease/Zn-finger nucleic acid-binding protein|nr:hypothetical protein [Candidatus Riflebacteria bacterium]